MPSKTVVFIHGMYMTPLCWGHWRTHFENRGYRCLAPAWPGRDEPVEVLRKKHPDPRLGQLTLRAILDHLADVVQGLREKPILIGHSMGGLVTQLLVQRGIAAAGIAIDSAPPPGVISFQWSFLKSNWPHINPFKPQDQPIEMMFERFQYTFVNTLPLAEQQAAYDCYVVPESRRVPAQALTPLARIDFRKPGVPLLLIAGSADNLIPASLNRSNHAKYRRPDSVNDFKEFPGRTHFIVGQSGWQEVADYTISWLQEHHV